MDQYREEKVKATIAKLHSKVKSLGYVLVFLFASFIWLITGMPGLSILEPTPVIVAEKTNDLPVQQDETEEIENGIHVLTGLKVDKDWELVRQNCTACHSPKLVTQNRATREGWKKMIKWMQETQNLWDLGESEPKILDYLAKNYAPKESGRRANLEITEWYEIN